MNVTDLDGKEIYLEDARELIAEGVASTPTRIILRETEGATIIDELHYADFEGKIRLDFGDLLARYSHDSLPSSSNTVFDADACLDLTLVVGSNSYEFTFYAASRDAESMISDIDFLFIPENLSLPVSFLFKGGGTEVNVFLESATGRTLISSLPTSELANGMLSMLFDIGSLPAGKSNFRLEYEVPRDFTTVFLRSPMYKVAPGDYELYLFKNRFGAMEVFPMRGAIEYVPTFNIETGRSGRSYRCTNVESDDILQQSSGNLTRKAAQVLTSFLRNGRGYHWTNEAWEPIVIEDINATIKTTDTMHRLSFSFRYQNPIETHNIM